MYKLVCMYISYVHIIHTIDTANIHTYIHIYIHTHTGSGNMIYASSKNIYLASTNYEYSPTEIRLLVKAVPNYGMWTIIIKFSLNNGELS